MKLSGKDADALAALAQGGDSAAFSELMAMFKPLVLSRARLLFLAGGDTDDLIQEAMIGLYKAVLAFDRTKSGFSGFAQMCIDRQLYSAVKLSRRVKHAALNDYVSIDGEDGQSLAEKLSGGGDPMDIFIEKDNADRLRETMRGALSAFERQVFDLYIDGGAYPDIARALGRPEKAVDNAVQRIKAKIRRDMPERT